MSAIAGLTPSGVTVVMSSEAWDAYQVPGSPYFVFVDGEHGRIVGEGTAPDWNQVVRLMTEAGDDGALEATRAETTRPSSGPSGAGSMTAPARLAPTTS